MKHKRDDGPEKQEDEAVDVTPVMTCVFVVMCCSMLVLLYYFYDLLGARPQAGGPRRGDAAGPEGGRVVCGPGLWPHGPAPAVYVVIGIFCLASATGLYSCLAPCVRRLPFGKCR